MEKHGPLKKIQSCKRHELVVEGKKRGDSIATDTQTSKPEFSQQSTQSEKKIAATEPIYSERSRKRAKVCGWKNSIPVTESKGRQNPGRNAS